MRRLMGALSTAALVLALAATTGQAGPAALAPQDATLQPTGMTTLVDVSMDGRIALGKVTETGDQFLTVELADGVRVKVQRHTISAVLPKGTLKNA